MENLDLGINLGFGTTESVDELTEKLKGIETTVENINEVSNNAMFTNALNTIMDMKKDLKDLEESIKKGNKDGNGSNADVVNNNKKQSFDLSQEMKNILNYLKTIATNTNTRYRPDGRKPSESNGGSSKPKLNETQELINSQLKNYYRGQGKFYNDKKWVNDSKITPMTSKQFEDGFSKLVKNLSKEVAETLNRNLQKSMVNNGAVEYFNKNKGKVTNEEELHRLYNEISQMVKTSGFNGNVLKYNQAFKKEYNDFKAQFNDDRTRAIRNNERLNKVYGMGKNVNYDDLSNNDIKRMLKEQSRILNIISSKQFRDFKSDKTNTKDKYYEFVNNNFERQYQVEQVKNKATSFSETLNNNMGMVIGGSALLGHLGQITNFLTSKEFERSMGALGIVGQLGNQYAINESKYTVMRESNSVNADITEFADNVREVIKTGKSYDQSMNLVKQAGKIAVASFEDLTTATDILNSRFTALDLSATNKNLNEFSNRLQSALDNTALDLQDIQYAGKQTNTAMNALINSAEEKGIQGRSVEDYTKSVSNIELSLLSELKQQGKSGEQAGIVIRTLFTKLMTADGVGGKMLDRDLSKMTKEEKDKVGFSNVTEMRDLVMGGEIEKVLNGLSELQKQGNLSYTTLKKLFTERHSSAISTLLTKVNGDINTFVNNITTGINVDKNFGKALDNWAIKFERIQKNLKAIATNTFTSGGFGVVLGGSVKYFDKGFDMLAKGMAHKDVLVRSVAQSLPQSMIVSNMAKGIYNNMQGRALNKIDNVYDNAINRISKFEGLENKDKIISRLEEMRNQSISKVMDSKGLEKFNETLKASRINVNKLSNELVQMGTQGTIETMKLTGATTTFGGVLKGVMSSLTPLLIVAGITTVINVITNAIQQAEKLKKDMDDQDEKLKSLKNYGGEIETLEKNIDNMFKVDDLDEDSGYIGNVKRMIQSNQDLKESLDNIIAMRDNVFKTTKELQDETWNTMTKNKLSDIKNGLEDKKKQIFDGRISLDSSSGVYKLKYGNSVDVFNDDGRKDRDFSVKYLGKDFEKSKPITKEDIEYYEKNKNKDWFRNNDYLKGLSNKFTGMYVYDELSGKGHNVDYKDSMYPKFTKVDMAFDKEFKDLDKQLEDLAKKQGKKVSDLSEDEKMLFKVREFKYTDEMIRNVLGEKIADKIGGKGIYDAKTFMEAVNSLEGANLEEKIMKFNKLMTAGTLFKDNVDVIISHSDYMLKTVKEADEKMIKQLEITKESLEQSKQLLQKYKNTINGYYEKAGLPNIMTGDLLEYKEDENKKPLTVSKERIAEYNKEYNKTINSIPVEYYETNMQGIKEYEANLGLIYQKKAQLEKELQDAEEELKKAQDSGNEMEIKRAKDKVEYIKKDQSVVKELEQQAKRVFELSNFTAHSVKELAQMSMELAKSKSQLNNLVGNAFGNKGSSLQTQFESLNLQRKFFKQYGSLQLNNQIMSARSLDPNGAIMGTLIGKTDYNKINMGDITKISNTIKDMKKNGITEKDFNGTKVNIDQLKEQAVIYTSILGEQINMEQTRVQLAQQEKQIKTDIVKYWLNEQKLKTEFVESGEVYTNENKQGSLPIIRKMVSGDNELYRMNDLQEMTNLKLENSNLRMKDQLDYARRQIEVARENAQRQINAIRRLEGTSSTNSRKSDINAKNNTVSTNNTIITSANTISANLTNAMQTILTSIQNLQMSYSTEDGGVSTFTDGTGGTYTQLPMMRGKGYRAFEPLGRAVSQLTGVPFSLLSAVVGQESNYDPNNRTFSGKTYATGLGQFISGYTKDYVKAYGKRAGVTMSNVNLLDPRQNALMLGYRLADIRREYQKTGKPFTDADVYMGHMNGNWKKYLGNLDVPATVIFSLKDLKVNARKQFYNSDGSIKTLRQVRDWTWKQALHNEGSGSSPSGSSAKSNYVMTGNVSSGASQQRSSTYFNGTTSYYSGGIRSIPEGMKFVKERKEKYHGVTSTTQEAINLVTSMFPKMYVTSKNEGTHSANSLHYQGLAFDFAGNRTEGLSKAQYKQRARQIVEEFAKRGIVARVYDEATGRSGNWTGEHLHIEVYGKGGMSYGGSQTQPLQLQTLTMPKEYVPNMSASTEKLIREITNNEFTKDMIKSQAEEEAATSIANKYKEFFDNSNNHVKSREQFNNWWNEYVLSHPNVDLSVSKDIARGILDREKTLLDTARDTYDKIVSQFIENVKNLTYSFGDLELKVKDVNTEWERNYNFISGSKLADTLYEFTKSIETNNVKISSLTRQLAKDIEINPNVTSLFSYLEDYMGIKFETQEDRYNFLMSNDNLMPIVKSLEDTMFDLAKDQFKNLGMDKLAFQQLSKEEKQEWLNKAYTALKKQGEENDDIFIKSQNFDNQTVIYKRLSEQVERNTEIHKAEADNFKLFNKSIEDLSNGIKELSDKMFNLESVRNLNTTLEEVKLLEKGIDLDSTFGKKRMAYIKAENSKKQLEENRQSVRTLLKASPYTISAMEMAGFNRNDLKNLDLNNFKNIQKLIEGISNFTETQNSVAKEMFNKFLDENPQLEKYRSFNIFDKEAVKEMKEQILNDGGIDNTKALELSNLLDNIENGFVKFDDIVNALQKLVTTIKDSNTQFMEMFKQFSTKSVDMLSSILFGTDLEWKGLDYKEALNYLFGMLSDDSKYIKKGFKKFFNIPQDEESTIEQDYISNRPSSLQAKNKAYIGDYDLRTLMLNKLDKFDLNDGKQDNIYLDENGNISKVYSLNDDFNASLIEMLKSDRTNKVTWAGMDVLPELEETGKLNLYEVETNAEKTKVWLRNIITNAKKYEKDVVGSLDDTVKSINDELTTFNKTSRDKIGTDKLNRIIGFEGVSTLNTPNYTAYHNRELRVIDNIERENSKLKRENEKNLTNSSDKIAKILQYNTDEVNRERNKKTVDDLLYMYDRLQLPIGEGNGISFKTDKGNKLIYKIVGQDEKDVEVGGTSNNITKEKLDNGVSFKVNGKEVYKLLVESKSKKIKTGKRKATIVDFKRVYLLDSNNKRKNLKDFTDYKAFNNFFINKDKEIMNDLYKKYPNTKTTKHITETELEPYYNVGTNTFYDDDYKKNNKIKIQYNGTKEQANNLYYTQNTESTNKYTDTSRNYGADNTLFIQNIEDLKTLAGLINPDRMTSYQTASKGIVSRSTTVNDSKGTVSEGKGRLTTEVDENGTYVNYLLDGKKIGTLGYEHPTTTTTTGKGKKKKTRTVTDEKTWQTYYIDETGKKTIYDKHLTSKEETEELIKDMMKTKDWELYKKYGMDNPTPKVETHKEQAPQTQTPQTQSSSFSAKYVDMLKRYEAFNEYVNSKEFIDILKDERVDKEGKARKINAWKKAFDILGDKNSKFTALQTIYESSWVPFKKSRIAKGYNFGGLTTPTKWGIEGKSTKGKDGQGHAVFRDMGTGIAGRLIYGYTEKAYNDLMYKGGSFSKFYEDYYGKYVGHDLSKYIKDIVNMGKSADINFKDDRIPSKKGENPFDVIPIKRSQKGFKDVDEDKIFEDLKKYREQTGDYSKFDIDNIKNLQSYTKQYNDSVLEAASTMKGLVIDTSKKEYLSASVEVSDYGDPAARQFAKDTVGIKDKQNYQERSNTYKGKKFKGYYEGYDDPEYILDIGHYAGESNAYTKDGIGEYEFNREILKKLAKEFEARGIKYGILEREKGAKKIDLDFVNENFKGAKLIELHNNADDDKSANGIEFLISNQKRDNDFGFTMLEELHKSTGMRLRGFKGQSPIHDGNGKQFAEGLTNLDNILVELGFLTNQNEVEKMLSNNSHDIVLGLLNGFLKSSGKETVNELLTISKDGTKKETQENSVKTEAVDNNVKNNENSNQKVPQPVPVIEIKEDQLKPTQDIQNFDGDFIELVRQREIERQKEEKEKKNQEREQKFQKPFAYATTIVTVIDGMLKRELNYKKKSLEVQAKILEMNLQMAETTEERRRIEEQILQNKLATVDNEYKTQSTFLGGMFGGTSGFALQGALGGATQGASIGGITGALVGTGLGFVGGLLGGTQAKIQAEQQKAQIVAQQKMQWLAEDRNRYLKTMASAMSEQAKWTTKIGVNDAISRSVRAVLTNTDTLGGTAYETKTVQNRKKKGGGLLGSKKYDTAEAFTASYNLNDSMFGGRQFNNRMDLEFAYTTLAQKLLGMRGNINAMGIYGNSPKQAFLSKYYRGGRIQQRYLPIDNGLNDYLQRRLSGSSKELTSSEFIRYFNGQGTLQGDRLLIDRSRDNEVDSLINNLKETAKAMPTGQQKVDTLALINFYENIKAVLDKEGKTTKRLFGNYYGIDTEEVKDEKGNITEYRRVNESMWSEMYQQIYQNVMNGTRTFDMGSKFISGTVNAFIQNVGSGRNTVKALTDEFNKLADQIYDVVTRTGEFTNVNGTIKSLIDNMFTLRHQQKETERFTVDLAKRWVALGGNITDVIKDMNNGLTTSMESIKSTMLGGSMEETINNFGNNLWQKLGESMTTNLINRKYANDIFKMNGLLTNATDSNSVSDIVALANGYKGLSTRIESDRERLSAIQRLFTANRDIDYVDESIQYETGTSQSITNNYTFTTDINAGTIVADELSKEILAQNLFAPLVQMLKDSGFIH